MSFTFKQENDPKCAAKVSMEWLRSKHVGLEWPGQSPDPNSSEKLCHQLNTDDRTPNKI